MTTKQVHRPGGPTVSQTLDRTPLLPALIGSHSDEAMMSSDGGLGKEEVVHIHYGIPLSHKKR